MAKRKKMGPVDFLLLISIISLVFIGLVMVYSSSWPEGINKYGSESFFFKRQAIGAVLGFILMLATMNIDYKIYKKYSIFIYLFAVILCLLIFTPLGMEIKGARRWLDLGFIVFMPSDVMKIASIIFFSAHLSNKGKKIKKFLSGTIPAASIIVFSVGLVYLQKDLGTMLNLLGALGIMFFVAGLNLLHLIPIFPLLGLFGYMSLMAPGNEYRLRRVLAFRDPFADKLGTGWQAAQSLYAIGSGGLLGMGIGKSRQKFFYIPEAYNDFIFSIIGEELGFIGSMIVIILFVIIIWRSMVIASKTRNLFGKYIAIGIGGLVAVQFLIHVGVTTSSIPVTGITLPFVSYGRTSLMIYMASAGILLNISRFIEVDGGDY